jgi:hypothetical protein
MNTITSNPKTNSGQVEASKPAPTAARSEIEEEIRTSYKDSLLVEDDKQELINLAIKKEIKLELSEEEKARLKELLAQHHRLIQQHLMDERMQS